MNTQKTMSNRQNLENRFKTARSNLLLVVLFTVINIILLVTQSNTYFLFSAYIPYAAVTIGMMLCGMFPAEYYGEDLSGVEFFGPAVFAIFAGIALVIVALYLLSWFLSKKNKMGWLIFALVIFVIDTLGMFAIEGFVLDSIVDILFHVWVIVSLSMGISACAKLKKLPEEETELSAAQQNEAYFGNSCMLRMADTEVKARVLLEANTLGHTVVYRRVKKVNELVVDGRVYDELEVVVETAHCLQARIDGHLIEAGYDGKSHSYLNVDGQRVTQKMRLY